MKFRTEYEARTERLRLDVDRPIVAVGSCFADNVTECMRKSGWEAATPLGVLFNPLSIARSISLSIFCDNPERDFKDSLFEADGIWHTWLADSRMSASDPKACIEKFKIAREMFRNMLAEGKTLIVTFGTAWCYFLRDTGNVVANCHKQPERLFERRLVEIDEIIREWNDIIPRLDCNIIFTVSPVRHIRDGLHGNNLSKATLMLAAERLCRQNENCFYFPAYEILNDDLRDYRFYADDLVHPSPAAVEYIWEKFKDTYLDPSGRETLKRREAELRRQAHRPIINGAKT